MKNNIQRSTFNVLVCLLLTLGAGCSSSENDTNRLREVTLTIIQSPSSQEGSGEVTRAVLSESGNTLAAEWASTDRVTYFNLDAGESGTLAVKPNETDKANAQFTGKVNCVMDDFNQVAVIYPTASVQNGTYAISLTGQDGTLATLAEQFHHIYGLSGKFYVDDDSPTASATVTMKSLLTVCKFSFTDGTSTIPVKTLQIAYGSNNSDSGTYPQTATYNVQGSLSNVSDSDTPLTITCGSEANAVYVALLPTDGQRTFRFKVTNSSGTYTGSAKATLKQGEYVPATGLRLKIEN